MFYQNALINLLYRILHRLRLWQIESNAFSKLPLIYSFDKGDYIPLMNISYFLLIRINGKVNIGKQIHLDRYFVVSSLVIFFWLVLLQILEENFQEANTFRRPIWYLHLLFRQIIRDFTHPKSLFLSSKLISNFSAFL